MTALTKLTLLIVVGCLLGIVLGIATVGGALGALLGLAVMAVVLVSCLQGLTP